MVGLSVFALRVTTVYLPEDKNVCLKPNLQWKRFPYQREGFSRPCCDRETRFHDVHSINVSQAFLEFKIGHMEN